MDFISIVGFMAATITTVGFIPQTVKTIRTKQANDVSLWMYIILAIGIILWLVYGLYNNDLPLILANSITFILLLPVLFIKIKKSGFKE